MSGDPEQEYFSDGITEDIITDLSKISGLFVVARNTAFTFKGRPINLQEAGRELGVDFLLEGSVRKAGSRVRVSNQLVNSEDGGHVWAERFDRDLTDIFSIQDEITHAIVEQLKVKLLPKEKKSIGQTRTDNVDAYTYYLRGRQFLHRHSKFITLWRGGCLQRRSSSIRNMRARMPAWPTAIRSCCCITMQTFRSREFLRTPARRFL